MRKHCARCLLICFSALFLVSCSVDNWLKKTETAKNAATATKAKPTPTLNATPQPNTKPVSETLTFKGDIAGKAGKEKLYRFLEQNDKKIVQLDLLLSDEQLEEVNELNKGKRWYFDLAYPDKEGFSTGGELWIDLSKGKSGLQLTGNHLQGQIKVVSWAGPHQGLMSINAQPVAAAAVKSATTNKVTPSPNTKSQAATRPRTAM
jgi:hypothetical protein